MKARNNKNRMGKAERTKGHNFEREVAKDLRAHGFPSASRHLEYQEGEANGVDLRDTGPYAVQCKCMKVPPNIPKVMEEIKTEQIPVVMFRITGKGSYAAFRYEDALKLMQTFAGVMGNSVKD